MPLTVSLSNHAHPADIRADVVDAMGNGFAEFLIDEVMDIDLVQAAFWPPGHALKKVAPLFRYLDIG